ncbi:phage tail assembly chaperone G [Bacillus sp. Hm123]|uniref:phage tail assembly chaperone G n=1 Tax=Bacillus sp. Hm123 TaxID=3450745 RepID=UPI003F4412D4
MNLTLNLKGKEMIFSTPKFVSGLVYRKILKLQADGRFPTSDPTDIDEIISLMCDTYENKFTIDEFWEGTHAPKVNETIWNFIQFINGTKDDEDNTQEKGK